MREEEYKFSNYMKEFHKLNISLILPEIRQGELVLLEAIVNQSSEETPAVKLSEIVQEMHAPASAVSRMLRSLEEKDIIVRTVNTKDRRSVYVELTEHGKEIYAESAEIMRDFADAIFKEMGKEEVELLNKYLNKLVETAKNEIEKRNYKKKRTEED